MKKCICALLALSLFLLCACGESSDPSKQRQSIPKLAVNDNVLKIAEKYIEILDQYLALEIMKDETDTLFSELEERMKTMTGVSYEDYEVGDPDYIVLHEISYLRHALKYNTDADLSVSRDIIAFHSGIDLQHDSTHTIPPYELRDYIDADEKEIIEKIGVVGLPASHAFVSIGDHSTLISVGFDVMYGISVSDYCQYAYSIFEKASALGEGFHVNVYLYEYDLSTLAISFEQEVSAVALDEIPANPDFFASIYRVDNYDSLLEVYTQSDLMPTAMKLWNAE